VINVTSFAGTAHFADNEGSLPYGISAPRTGAQPRCQAHARRKYTNSLALGVTTFCKKKKKGKFSLEQATKTQRVSRVIALLFL